MDGREFNAEPEQAAALQVERILQSETLRSSEALRRLLRYLAQKTIAGEADQLKEYTVAIEALGKPDSYDPRQESAVRIQVGRLRQKLVEFYHSEGKEDPVLVDLPRGRFRLSFETRTSDTQVPTVDDVEPAPPASRRYTVLLAVLLLITFGWAVYSTALLLSERKSSSVFHNSWTPEVSALWEPFVSTSRPLIIAVATWPFANVPGFGVFWSYGARTWDEMMQSPVTAAVRKINGNVSPQPYYFFTSTSTAAASLYLGRLLGPHIPSMSVVRTAEFTWQQLAENNVIYLGNPAQIQDKLQSLPTELEFVQTTREIKVLHPRPGEAASLTFAPGAPGSQAATGETYVLVTNVAGPEGKGVIRSFASTGPSARVGALSALIDPASASELAARLRDRSGRIPRNFQLVLRVKYTDAVVTRTEYVTHRELFSKKVLSP
jgi:hypothetical protein